MRTSTLFVTFALCCPLWAQNNAPVPPRVLRTAEIIGVRTDLERLAALNTTEHSDELQQLRLAQRLQSAVITSALDIDSVDARIEYESARLQEIQAFLSAKRDQKMNLLNVGNLVIGSGVGAVGSGLQLISSAQHAGNVVSTAAGAGATILSILGLRNPTGIMRAPGYTPAMLAQPLGIAPPVGSEYPPVVWKYLTTPDSELPRNNSGEEHLKFEWIDFGRMKANPDTKKVNQLTSTGKAGTPLGLNVISDRLAMLADVRAHVTSMQVDLADLMRFLNTLNNPSDASK